MAHGFAFSSSGFKSRFDPNKEMLNPKLSVTSVHSCAVYHIFPLNSIEDTAL